jgi:hypothetical protein
LAIAAQVKLEAINVLGEVVSTLANGTLTAGIHEFNFNAGGLPSGIYFCRLSAGEKVSIMKMNLIK